MSDVREGTVNGLPAVAIYKTCEGRWPDAPWGDKDVPPLGYQGPWMVGFPDWWPHPPSERCPDCGFNYKEASEWSLGHVCPGIEQPDDPDKARVVQHPVEFLTDEDEWENLP